MLQQHIGIYCKQPCLFVFTGQADAGYASYVGATSAIKYPGASNMAAAAAAMAGGSSGGSSTTARGSSPTGSGGAWARYSAAAASTGAQSSAAYSGQMSPGNAQAGRRESFV